MWAAAWRCAARCPQPHFACGMSSEAAKQELLLYGQLGPEIRSGSAGKWPKVQCCTQPLPEAFAPVPSRLFSSYRNPSGGIPTALHTGAIKQALLCLTLCLELSQE